MPCTPAHRGSRRAAAPHKLTGRQIRRPVPATAAHVPGGPMLDYVIRSGTLIDGTGGPAAWPTSGSATGGSSPSAQVDEPATTEFDATGLMVAPGVVDPHTHYDAQLFWDPSASPSNVHGVTTVIGGNCGFTLAPINAEDADYIRRMMAKVEGMPLAALENGVPVDLVQLRRVPRRARGQPRRERRASWSATARCGARSWAAARGEEVATDDEIAAMRDASGRVARGRRARLLVLAVAHPLRRGRPARSARATPTAARCSPSVRRWRPTRARRSSTSPTAASTRSAPRRSTS